MINADIFNFAYGEALNDLQWRSGLNKGLKNDVAGKDEIKEIVKEYATQVLNGDKPCTYLCISYISNIKIGKKHLSYGNAQKLINMTMKYLYIICCVDEKYKDCFSNCHVPMDSIMLALAIAKTENNELKKISSWSQLDGDDGAEKYRSFQDAIAKLCTQSECLPIEFDYLYWSKAKMAKDKYENSPNKKELGKNLYKYIGKEVKLKNEEGC